MKKNKIMIIVLFMLISLTALSLLAKNTKAEGYPVLEWDQTPPSFVGDEFTIMFTCFSDSNQTINVEIWIDELDLEWFADEEYFVNQEVIISTEDQLSGTGHTLEIIATDYLLREAKLITQLTIDSVDPVFNYCEATPTNSEGKIEIDRTTPLNINWSVTDENFADIRIYHMGNIHMVSIEPIGHFSFSFFYLETTNFEIVVTARDDANNTVSRTFSVHYFVDDGEWIPKDEVDELIEQNKQDRIMALVGASIAVFLTLVIIVPMAFYGASKKRELKA